MSVLNPVITRLRLDEERGARIKGGVQAPFGGGKFKVAQPSEGGQSPCKTGLSSPRGSALTLNRAWTRICLCHDSQTPERLPAGRIFQRELTGGRSEEHTSELQSR